MANYILGVCPGNLDECKKNDQNLKFEPHYARMMTVQIDFLRSFKAAKVFS